MTAALLAAALVLAAWATATYGEQGPSVTPRRTEEGQPVRTAAPTTGTPGTTGSPSSSTPANTSVPATPPTSATTTTAPTPGAVYWLGDSITTGFSFYGDLYGKLVAKGYGPVTINDDPGRSITGGGFNRQSALQAIEKDAGQVRSAGTIVIELGVNPEATLDFATAQRRLLTRLHDLNPTARVVWVDIAGSVNEDYVKTLPNFRSVDHRAENQYKQNLIYVNRTGSLPYDVVSQYQYVWGPNTNPSQLARQRYPDPHRLLSIDGVHYTEEACDPVARYLVDAVASGR